VSAVRTGKLLKETVYLVNKNPNGPNTDIYYTMPAGTPVEWRGGTNAGSEDYYGGRTLYWLWLPGEWNVGAELGVDFEWDEA
jgi:hypothetical protein